MKFGETTGGHLASNNPNGPDKTYQFFSVSGFVPHENESASRYSVGEGIMDTDLSSSGMTKAALRFSSGFIRHPIAHERRQVQTEKEDSIPKESLTKKKKKKVNENESSNHKRILTIQDAPSDIKVSQDQIQSPDAKVSRAYISPDAEVS